MQNAHTTRGLTLIEVLIVVGLLSIVLAFGVVMSFSSIARVNAIQERDLLVSLLLSGARAQALANIDDDHHGVHIETDKYVLFNGVNWASATNKRDVARNAAVTVSHPDGDTIIFEKHSGNVLVGTNPGTGIGTLTLTGNGQSTAFTINKVGRIDW